MRLLNDEIGFTGERLNEMAEGHQERGRINETFGRYVDQRIRAVFGIPLPSANHEIQAVRAALAMRKRLEVVNQRLSSQGLQPLQHGIGIHTGQVLAASIGSPDRQSYAIIGDTVQGKRDPVTTLAVEGLAADC